MPRCGAGSALIQTACRVLLCLSDMTAVIFYYVVRGKGGPSAGNQEDLKPEPASCAAAALSSDAPHTLHIQRAGGRLVSEILMNVVGNRSHRRLKCKLCKGGPDVSILLLDSSTPLRK